MYLRLSSRTYIPNYSSNIPKREFNGTAKLGGINTHWHTDRIAA